MKMQFSLATLLVCVTVLAVVCTIAAFVPIRTAGVVPATPGNVQLSSVRIQHWVEA